MPSSASCFSLKMTTGVGQRTKTRGRGRPRSFSSFVNWPCCRSDAQRKELTSGLEHAQFGALWKDNPLEMTLQFFDDTADESHGVLVAHH